MSEDLEQAAADPEVAAAELAKPEDISAFVEERKDQEEPPSDVDELLQKKHPGEYQEQKKASRYERLKKARDSYKSEVEDLRRQLGEREAAPSEPHQAARMETHALENFLKLSHDKHGDKFTDAYNAFMDHMSKTADQAAYNQIMAAADPGEALVQWFEQPPSPTAPADPIAAAIAQGRQDQDFQQALAAHGAEVQIQTEARIRAEEFAKVCPDLYDTIGAIEGIYNVPPLMADLIRRSPVGPQIAWCMANDALQNWDQSSLANWEKIANDPIAQAREFGKAEQAVMMVWEQMRNGGAAQRRVTQAPPPIKPVTGRASPKKDLNSLAASMDASEYIAARRGR